MQKKGSLIRVMVLAAAAAVFLWPGNAAAGQDRPGGPDPETAGRGPDGPVYLYFADPQTGYLTGEARHMERRPDAPAFYRQIIKALIAGPENDLMRTLPGQTRLRALYPTEEGIVYVDLSGEVAEQHPRGVRSELLSVYSIVNTLILNTEGIRGVKILINGGESGTLAGHIDIRLPLKAQMLLVR